MSQHPTYSELLDAMCEYAKEQKACDNPARLQDLREFRRWKNMPQDPEFDKALLADIENFHRGAERGH